MDRLLGVRQRRGADSSVMRWLLLCVVVLVPLDAHAQGLVEGVQQGSRAGQQAAGPVGGVLGGAIGGVVGVVGGVLGTPNAATPPSSQQQQAEPPPSAPPASPQKAAAGKPDKKSAARKPAAAAAVKPAPASPPAAIDPSKLAEQIVANSDANIARFKAELKLTPEQEKNWGAFNAAMRNLGLNGAERVKLRAARARRDPPDDIVDQMRNEAQFLYDRAQDQRNVADAADPLFLSLDDKQKTLFIAEMVRLSRERGLD